MKTYTVTSAMRDRRGRQLSTHDILKGEFASVKDALAKAHPLIAETARKDVRVDSIATTVRAADGEAVSTTDFLEDLTSGLSASGLLEEVRVEEPTAIERYPNVGREGLYVNGQWVGRLGDVDAIWDPGSNDPRKDIQSAIQEINDRAGLDPADVTNIRMVIVDIIRDLHDSGRRPEYLELSPKAAAAVGGQGYLPPSGNIYGVPFRTVMDQDESVPVKVHIYPGRFAVPLEFQRIDFNSPAMERVRRFILNGGQE